MKEHGGPEGAVIGHGVVLWKEILETVEAVGGKECYTVEHETGPTSWRASKAVWRDS